ncbi:odorant receptor 4-like [Osmia bicornis bicornis]|uniref:odorant receptor 4-like n=1 Tax=Osmia bicornis bicornis TaxID=1437191 RepID=UPI0010F4A587|nr:odorant receptor 4-like [Osmia bicornis bicornis]
MTTVKPTTLQTDLDYSLQLNRWLLKPIGVWPKSSTTTKTEKVISLILNVICYSFITITVVPCILHLVLEDDDIRTKLILFGPLCHWVFGCIDYTTLLMYSKEINWCVEQMKSDWHAVTRAEVQKVMLKNAKIGRYVAAFCATFMHAAIVFYNIVQTLTTEIIQVGNETRIVRMLPCVAYKKLIPVDTNPTNEIIFVVQLISGFIVTSGLVGALSLATAFTAHVYGQLNILMMWISEFVNQSRHHDKCADLNGIRAIVEKHLTIFSFISHIDTIINGICFMELLRVTFSACLLGYYILVEWANQDFQNMISYALVLGSYSFHIFTLCFIGETITEQCNKVGEAVYMSNWYYLPERDILDLMLILSRSYVTTKITAGKIIHMSFYAFASVMKTAFAYLNILLQML